MSSQFRARIELKGMLDPNILKSEEITDLFFKNDLIVHTTLKHSSKSNPGDVVYGDDLITIIHIFRSSIVKKNDISKDEWNIILLTICLCLDKMKVRYNLLEDDENGNIKTGI